MKLNFGAAKNDNSDDDDDEEECDGESLPGMRESRNKIQNREPRVLSESSRQTRKRLGIDQSDHSIS